MVGFRSDESQALEEEGREGSSSSLVLFAMVVERRVLLWMASREVWDSDCFAAMNGRHKIMDHGPARTIHTNFPFSLVSLA